MSRYTAAPNPVRVLGLWLSVFSATLAAILLGGLILGVSVRLYLRWSVEDSLRQVKEAERKPAAK